MGDKKKKSEVEAEIKSQQEKGVETMVEKSEENKNDDSSDHDIEKQDAALNKVIKEFKLHQKEKEKEVRSEGGEEYDDSIVTNMDKEESLEVNPEVRWDFNLTDVKKEDDRWYRGLERHAYETKCKSYTTKEVYRMWDSSSPFLV